MQESITAGTAYPDVLGSITGGTRISMDKLQCALGHFSNTNLHEPAG